MIDSFDLKSLWALARFLPSALIRWRFPAARMASLVQVDLRPRHDPVVLQLHPGGSAQVYLQITNLCPTRIELDQASFTLQCAGPTVSFIHLEKVLLEVGETKEVFLSKQIPNEIARSMARNGERFASLYGNMEFTSAIRPFARRVPHLDGIRPYLLNPAAAFSS